MNQVRIFSSPSALSLRGGEEVRSLATTYLGQVQHQRSTSLHLRQATGDNIKFKVIHSQE